MALGAELLDVFFPPECVACGQVLDGHTYFCASCARELDVLSGPACARCGEPGVFPTRKCPRCTAHPPKFAAAWAPWGHSGAVARAIHRFKYEDHPELARPLANALIRALPLEITGAVVVPVPLHRTRFLERKFDQSALLAHQLAKLLKLPLKDEWLTRTRPTDRQVGKTDAERVSNVAGAFAALGVAPGAKVLLIDDVLTTGATASAAAGVLLSAGAGEVRVVTLARALRET